MTSDLPKANGTCPKCNYANSMVWIPKHRDGIRGRFCEQCGETNYDDPLADYFGVFVSKCVCGQIFDHHCRNTLICSECMAGEIPKK